MGSARFELIIDFYRHEVDVALRCDGCKHTRLLTVQQVGKIFGIEERIAKCARRLVCSRCGHKGGRMTPIPKLDPRAEKRERQNQPSTALDSPQAK